MDVILTWGVRSEGQSATPMVSAMAAIIRRIPRGKVSTYGAVAKAAGYPRCSRHVAAGAEPNPGIALQQRVLGSGGKISLTGEYAMEQRFLLEFRKGCASTGVESTLSRDSEFRFGRSASKSCQEAVPQEENESQNSKKALPIFFCDSGERCLRMVVVH